MSDDDLVTRLRQLGDKTGLMYADYDTTIEAADRIKKLEAALREVAEAVGDPSAYWIARNALEGKDD